MCVCIFLGPLVEAMKIIGTEILNHMLTFYSKTRSDIACVAFDIILFAMLPLKISPGVALCCSGLSQHLAD